MNSTLDFVMRARHALQEFRAPSQLQAPTAAHHGQEDLAEKGLGGDVHAGERHDPSKHDPYARTALENYRLLVGIHQDKSFSPPHGFSPNRRPQVTVDHRPSPNLGIYSTVCDAEIKQKRNYNFTSRLINVCFGLQIVVAAALTALGAANGSRSAVTVLGATNTIIAGFLTYLKGSGLPHRLKYYQHEWAKVREYIEQRERDFSFGVLTADHVQSEVVVVREMYELVKADIESNRPDRFVGTNPQHLRGGAAPSPASLPPLSLPFRNLTEGAAAKQQKWTHDIEAKQSDASAAMHHAQSSAHALFGQARGVKDRLEHKLHDLGRMEKEMEAHGREMAAEQQHGLAARVERAGDDIATLGHQLETTATDAVARQRSGVEDAVARQRSGVEDAVARQRIVVADASSAARDGVVRQREAAEQALARTEEAATGAVTQQRHAAEDAMTAAAQAATDAIDEQRTAAAATIAPRR